ncbi:MAG: tetratricopeptide repeat protein [Bradymonadia bacterium]
MFCLREHKSNLSLLVCLLVGVWCANAYASPAGDDEVDHVALAERLFADGHLERAKQTLTRVDVNKEGLDLKAYYLVSGLIDLQENRHQAAESKFQKAINLGEKRTIVLMGLAQAHYQQQEFSDALSALKRTQPMYGGSPTGFLMAAHCLWAENELNEAFETLRHGQSLFPLNLTLLRQDLLYLIERELFHEAIVRGSALLTHSAVTEDDILAIAHAFRSANQHFQSIHFLERARLLHKHTTRLTELLAHVYLSVNRPYVSGMLFESLARLDARYAFEAAQAFKAARRFSRALALNTRVLESDKRFKQRLSILIDDGRFFEVAAMEETLERLALLKDDEIRYALAYAHFKSAEGARAKTHLNAIEDPKLFDQVSALRRSILGCEESGWKCL